MYYSDNAEYNICNTYNIHTYNPRMHLLFVFLMLFLALRDAQCQCFKSLSQNCSLLTNLNTESTPFCLQICSRSYKSATARQHFVLRLQACQLRLKMKWTATLDTRESASPAVSVAFRISKVVRLQSVFCNRRGPRSHNSHSSPTETHIADSPVTRRRIQWQTQARWKQECVCWPHMEPSMEEGRCNHCTTVSSVCKKDH